MKTALTLILTLATSVFFSGNNLLGTYRVVYKDKTETYHIYFQDSVFEKLYQDGTKTTGKISKIEDKESAKVLYYLYDNHDTVANGKINSLLVKSFGTPIIELEASGKKTIRFRTTYSSNLRITINEGLLIKEGK